MKKTYSKKTVLYNKHIELGGRLVDFGGYILPLYYSSIKSEHNSVRKDAGIFDVSHMCEIIISGKKCEEFVQEITVNDTNNLTYGNVQYTLMCNHYGGIIDDLLVYKKKTSFMLVLNAGNVKRKICWIKSLIKEDVKIENVSEKTSLIALQGPNSRKILEKLIDSNLENLLYYNFIETNISNKKIILSRTGYTGELGYEIYLDVSDAEYVWNKIMNAGKKFSLVPAGLGCRDTLRTEMGYVLYGNEINENTSPLEAGLNWVVKFDKGDFIGKSALINKEKKTERKLVFIEMEDGAIPRRNYQIIKKNKTIGSITSGTISPSLGKGIAMGYVLSEFSNVKNTIQVDIRGQLRPGVIINGPFYKSGSVKS